jgi:hypothetical protein
VPNVERQSTGFQLRKKKSIEQPILKFPVSCDIFFRRVAIKPTAVHDHMVTDWLLMAWILNLTYAVPACAATPLNPMD